MRLLISKFLIQLRTADAPEQCNNMRIIDKVISALKVKRKNFKRDALEVSRYTVFKHFPIVYYVLKTSRRFLPDRVQDLPHSAKRLQDAV